MLHLNPEYLLLFALIPIAGIIIGREENIKIDKRKVYAGFFIILLLAITPSFSIEPAFAENRLRQIIKISDTYPADVASFTVPIDPPLQSIDRAFVFYTVAHTTENDASDFFKTVKILDKNTLLLIGEDTALGNNAVEFIAYIVEYDSDSEINVQHLQ